MVQANEEMDERIAQYCTRLSLTHSAYRASIYPAQEHYLILAFELEVFLSNERFLQLFPFLGPFILLKNKTLSISSLVRFSVLFVPSPLRHLEFTY